MIKTTILYSGSEGNSTLISDENTNILIDAGGCEKHLKLGLEKIGKTIEDVSAIFITHEHTDHTKSLYTLLKHCDIPVYTSINTARGICSIKNVIPDTLKCIARHINTVNAGLTYEIGTLLITPFPVPHDVEAHGIKITSDNDSVTYATDTGKITHEMLEYFKGSRLAIIESNHDKEMLITGPYPEFLKQRILSDMGHLSNEVASKFALWLAQNGTEKIILAHLSKENNTPTLAKSVTREMLDNNGFNGVNLKIASPDEIVEETL